MRINKLKIQCSEIIHISVFLQTLDNKQNKGEISKSLTYIDKIIQITSKDYILTFKFKL